MNLCIIYVFVYFGNAPVRLPKDIGGSSRKGRQEDNKKECLS